VSLRKNSQRVATRDLRPRQAKTEPPAACGCAESFSHLNSIPFDGMQPHTPVFLQTNSENAGILSLFNLLKYSGNYMYHQPFNNKPVFFRRIEFMCFRMILRTDSDYFVNSTNQMTFVMQTRGVLFEARTECLGLSFRRSFVSLQLKLTYGIICCAKPRLAEALCTFYALYPRQKYIFCLHITCGNTVEFWQRPGLLTHDRPDLSLQRAPDDEKDRKGQEKLISGNGSRRGLDTKTQ
jgi:hypothetical protein